MTGVIVCFSPAVLQQVLFFRKLCLIMHISLHRVGLLLTEGPITILKKNTEHDNWKTHVVKLDNTNF